MKIKAFKVEQWMNDYEKHVLALPGNAFGECGEGYLRIACTVNIDKLKEAFDRIENIKIYKKISPYKSKVLFFQVKFSFNQVEYELN